MNYKTYNSNRIFKLIDSMPMAKYKSKIDAKNLSLYSDYNPKTTIKGLGFKDKDKALILPVLNQISEKYQNIIYFVTFFG